MNRSRLCGLACALVFLLLLPSIAPADVLPWGLKIEKVLSSSADVGDLAQAPTGELWVLERTTGTIRVYVAGVEADSLVLPVTAACNSGLLDVAFDPHYGRNGRAMVSYVDGTGLLRVDEVRFQGRALSLGANLISIGTIGLGCRPGGGMVVGNDGKLYVGAGDLDVGANGQAGGVLAGKILRAELDGSIPGDNPSGTLVWASGFRNGVDLAVNRETGGIYMIDMAAAPGETADGSRDEINRLFGGENYWWNLGSGNAPMTYRNPIVHYSSLRVEGLEVLTGTALGAANEHALFWPAVTANFIARVTVDGPNLDHLVAQGPFFSPNADRDGVADSGCPQRFTAITQSQDGLLYAANRPGTPETNPGVWRIWRDTPGPREVSGPGSPFHVTLDREGDDLRIGWENLGTVDAGRPVRHMGQHPERYQIWEGTLPIGGTYDHAPIAASDGTPSGLGRLTAAFTPGEGDHYYLVSAQGDNLEGPLGAASDGTPRSEPIDYCTPGDYGIQEGDCAEPWYDHATGGVLRLRDENPNSPTFNQLITMSDFRGRVIKMDISALNCVFCNLQAPYHAGLDLKYRDRDLVIITLLTEDFTTLEPIPDANCKQSVINWATSHGEYNPIVCDVDRNGDNLGDLSIQYWHQADCGGTPQNFYFDQGHVLKDFVCGGELSLAEQEAHVTAEVNPETCE